jgi:hypothetical protein
MSERIWQCTIGGEADELPYGADLPMRTAISKAFRRITGREPPFSGYLGKVFVDKWDALESRAVGEVVVELRLAEGKSEP